MLAPKILEHVRQELKYDPRIDEAKINVYVTDKGVVTLTGSAETYWQKLAAEGAAKRVSGVRAVANDIQVHIPPTVSRTDTQIAGAVVTSLEWHPSIPAERIKVTVSDGWVTLDGEVELYHQKQEAELAVSMLHGVKGVTNDLRLRPVTVGPNSEQVAQEIEDALVRSARVDAGGIKVRIEDSRAILEGMVRSWAELIEAEDAAWSAPGVTDVENRLEVV
jgi:osmotically-inducible protein OsmY